MDRSAGVYVTIHEGGREHLLRESLTSLEEKLDPRRFARIQDRNPSSLKAVFSAVPAGFSPAAGHYAVQQTVTLTSETPGAGQFETHAIEFVGGTGGGRRPRRSSKCPG